MRSDSAIAAASWAGDKGAEFAAKGDRYLPRGGVRHRTQQSIFASFLRTAACGIVASEAEWRGAGSQDEYERLSRIPRCSNCIRVALAAAQPEPTPPHACPCWTCESERRAEMAFPESICFPFIVCQLCGNKRCPKATHHKNDCTGSNKPGQVGSRYRAAPTSDSGQGEQ